MTRSRIVILFAIPCVLVVAAALLARPLGVLTTTMTVSEYDVYAKGGSMRAFSVTGRAGAGRATGEHTERAGAYEVTFKGGLELQTADGRRMHQLQLRGDDGATAMFYFDPKVVASPLHDRRVELRGRFKTTRVMRPLAPPSELTFGEVREMVLLD